MGVQNSPCPTETVQGPFLPPRTCSATALGRVPAVGVHEAPEKYVLEAGPLTHRLACLFHHWHFLCLQCPRLELLWSRSPFLMRGAFLCRHEYQD